MKIYYPSMYGDFRLEAVEKNVCALVTAELSPLEKRIVDDLLKKFKVEPNAGNTNSRFLIERSLTKVNECMHKLIAKHKKTEAITAVKVAIADAAHLQLEEVRGEIDSDGGDAITTPLPKRGCPMPVYDPVAARHIRAEAVLKRFLSPQQTEDYMAGHAFVVFGGSSHHRYLVSHRNSRSAAKLGIVYDLEMTERICVEPSMLPPSEEVLAIMVALQCRERQWTGSLS